MTYIILMIALLVFSIHDLKTGIVPNRWILFMGLILLISSVIDFKGIQLSYRSAFLAVLMSFVFFKFKILGGADLKILMMMSPFFNENELVIILLASMLVFILAAFPLKKIRFAQLLSGLGYKGVRQYNRYPFVWAYLIPVLIFSIK